MHRNHSHKTQPGQAGSTPRRERLWVLFCLVGLMSGIALNAGEPTSAEREAQEIVERIRTTRPPGNSTAAGVFKVFQGRRLRAVVPFRTEVLVTATNWQVVYQMLPSTNAFPLERLVITRGADSTLDYEVTPATPAARSAAFAGSEFLAADLGLDFLNWPGQRMLKKEVRSSQSCYVIESTNPGTNSLPYSRVVTWLDIDSVRDLGAPAIVHADAYDRRGKKLKEFAPKDFRKVDGQWQVEELQIENVQTDNKTKIEFDFGPN